MPLEQLLRKIEAAEDQLFNDLGKMPENNKGAQMLRNICLSLLEEEILYDPKNSAINRLIIEELSTLFEEQDEDVVSLSDLQEVTEKGALIPRLFNTVTAFFGRLSPISVTHTPEYQRLPNVFE